MSKRRWIYAVCFWNNKIKHKYLRFYDTEKGAKDYIASRLEETTKKFSGELTVHKIVLYKHSEETRVADDLTDTIKEMRNENQANLPKEKRMYQLSETPCLEESEDPNDGFKCTLRKDHADGHIAHQSLGEICFAWG